MYCIFPKLPPINTNATPSQISNWKNNSIVAECHKALFKQAENSATFMTKIIDKVWPMKKKAPKIHIAYAISVCEFILNPENQNITISESFIKCKISKYLQKILNKEKLHSDDDSEANSEGAAKQECDDKSDDKSEEGQGQENENDEIIQEIVDEVQSGDGGEVDYYSSEEERLNAEQLKKKYKKKY